MGYDREKRCIIRRNNKYLDEFRGCMLGGAIGDALGYPLEGMRAREIFEKYGEEGIKGYSLTRNGKALISANTQMALFTATGLLMGKTRGCMRGIIGSPWGYADFAYGTWYRMQKGLELRDYEYSWLRDVPEMGESRAPGNACLSAIAENKHGSPEKPVNNSKGCGAVTRVAPVGLYFNRLQLREKPGDEAYWIDAVWANAARIAALTHGHELGWMPAAAFAHIINRLCFTGKYLDGIIRETLDMLREFYGDGRHVSSLASKISLARELARNGEPDLDNIGQLGAGWVAEEALAIAVYCSLRHEDDFSKAVCAAVNHDGDSDATGALTGNIMGTLYGYDAIPDVWKENLELKDVILEVADDLCMDCQIEEYDYPYDEEWETKYIRNKRYVKKEVPCAMALDEGKGGGA